MRTRPFRKGDGLVQETGTSRSPRHHPPDDPQYGLTDHERELLRLLGTGLTDEAAGQRLGLTDRTIRRQVASIMERLGATSRFEAGTKAAQRGWL
ncbi:LuxR C-terminal-related transcriptional regulator [Streptomyces sp. NPDC051563]|uniref:LuxR C-terminal-related transcriptional regulator n=1 Tax=Streptomyces sp. NPDC051563 TaxID=3365659 RepID=UPI0037924ECF